MLYWGHQGTGAGTAPGISRSLVALVLYLPPVGCTSTFMTITTITIITITIITAITTIIIIIY